MEAATFGSQRSKPLKTYEATSKERADGAKEEVSLLKTARSKGAVESCERTGLMNL